MNVWKRSVFSVYIQCVLPHELSYAFSLVLLEANASQLAVGFMDCACPCVVPLEQQASLQCSCVIPLSFILTCVEK